MLRHQLDEKTHANIEGFRRIGAIGFQKFQFNFQFFPIVSDDSPVLIELRSTNCEQFEIANPDWTSKWCEDVSSSMKRSRVFIGWTGNWISNPERDSQNSIWFFFIEQKHRSRSTLWRRLASKQPMFEHQNKSSKNFKKNWTCWGYLRTPRR